MNDIDWDLLIRYVAGVCTDAEREDVDRWVDSSPEHRAILAGVRDELARAPRDLAAERADAMLAVLERETSLPLSAVANAGRPPLTVVRSERPRTVRLTLPRHRRPPFLRAGLAAAAVLVMAIGAVVVRRTVREGAEQTAAKVVATARTQRLAVRLPDNTLVVLAPESRLEVVPGYGKAERRVRLQGEAVFTVEHDDARPFAVETRRAVARDLGTKFVVREYPTDSTTDVVVAEGVVALAASRDSVVMNPGQLARVDRDGRVGMTRGVAVGDYFAWTDGRLVFDDVALADVAATIERWYDVDVRLATPNLRTLPVTASFERERPADIVRLVAGLLDLEVGVDTSGHRPVYTWRIRS